MSIIFKIPNMFQVDLDEDEFESVNMSDYVDVSKA